VNVGRTRVCKVLQTSGLQPQGRRRWERGWGSWRGEGLEAEEGVREE